MVYNPGKTMFLKKGEEKGAMIKNGADMLIFQAEENWRIWNDLTIV
jgi:shikimate dehydrogenase